MSPSDQLSGTIPESRIMLNNLTYIGHIIVIVLLICSFKILSIPLLLLLFKIFTVTVFKISSPVNELFIFSLILSVKLLLSKVSDSYVFSALIFLKKSNKFCGLYYQANL